MKGTTMEQDVYEALIAPYTTKVIDTDNPDLYKFKVTVKIKHRVLEVGKDIPKPPKERRGNQYRQVKPVITPLGKFASMKEAAEAHGITTAGIAARITRSTENGTQDYRRA